jgi:hypothetical protein
MYWKGMRTTILRYVKTCRSCQVNKRHSQKYGHLPPKLVITTPWKDAAWAVCSTYHTVLKASPGAAIFGRDMLFDILLIADWQKIGEHRQQLTDLNNAHENKGRVDYDYKVGQKVLLLEEGILHNTESRWYIKPWLITSVHSNGTITVQRGNKIEQMNIRQVNCLKKI